MKKLIISSKLSLAGFLAIFQIAVSLTQAQEFTVDMTWGATLTNDYYMIGNSAGDAYGGGATIVAGYFTDGFNVEESASNFEEALGAFKPFIDATSTSENVIYTESIIGDSYPGFAQGSNTLNVPNGSEYYEKTVYYMVFEGVTSYDQASVSSVSSYAILSNSAWNSVPEGTEFGEAYDIQTTYLDVIYGGSRTYNDGTYVHNVYTTAAVPEPAFYATGLGLIALLIVQLRRRRAK